MAVTKIWSVTSNLSGVQGYISNSDKTTISAEEYMEMHTPDSLYTENEELCLVKGINCSPKHAIEEFMMVKEQFGKTTGIQAYHGCISFAEGEVTPKETVDIAKEFVNTVWGDNYQVLMAAHLNTSHLHCHYLINSVSFVDGHRLHDEFAWFKFRHIADEICKARGKSVIENPNRGRREGLTEREEAAKACLDRALSKSRSYAEFLAKIQQEPCSINFSMHNKSWTLLPDGWTIPVSIAKCGEEYSKDSILKRFPDSLDVVERFVVPDVLDDVDLKGFQNSASEIAKRLIRDNLIVNDLEPTRMYLPHKVKEKVEAISSAISFAKQENVTELSDIGRLFLILDSYNRSLREKRDDAFGNRLGESAFEKLNKDIQEVSRAIRGLQEIRILETLSTKNKSNIEREERDYL